jgi:hypothetical protein
MLLHEEWLEAAAFLKSSDISTEEKALAVNYINTDGCSTLLLAALHGAHLSLIKQILNVGDVNVLLKGTAGSGWTPLIIACDRYDHSQVGKDHLDFIKLLIQVGGKDLVCRVDGSLRTALHWACDKVTPYSEVIRLLLACGGKDLLLKVDCDNNTALHNICMQQNVPVDVIKSLIEKGGKDVCRLKNKKGETALQLYCRVKCPVVDVVENFVAAGGKEVLNAMDIHERKAIDEIMDNKHIDNDVKELWKRLLTSGNSVLSIRNKNTEASIQALHLQINKLENIIITYNEQIMKRLNKLESFMDSGGGKRQLDETESSLESNKRVCM